MKRSRVPDGDIALPCSATVRIERGRDLTVFFHSNGPTPSRVRVQREVSELTGLPVWLEDWPEGASLDLGVRWPGIEYAALVLDYDERIRASRDIAALGGHLTEILEVGLPSAVGWTALGVDPEHLPSFGGERPDVPASFYWRWKIADGYADQGLPPMPLSWDPEHVLVAADPHHGPFRVARHPSHLFSGPVARRCGLRECSDAVAFEQLSTVLPWSGDMLSIGARELYILSACERGGTRYGAGDPRDLGVVVRETPGSRAPRLRDVIAVGTSSALRNREIAAEIVRAHAGRPAE
ncbi:MAG: hypothetical protein H0T42_02970 [Deltaproteobacteria bacterium]|nr:hypothetical protein [Deltaproteobacteria bacterium]